MLWNEFLSWCTAFLAVLCILFAAVLVISMCFICKYYSETLDMLQSTKTASTDSYTQRLVKKDSNCEWDIEMEVPRFSRLAFPQFTSDNEDQLPVYYALEQDSEFQNDEVFHYSTPIATK